MSDVFVHQTAVVDQPCEIGAGSKIWHFCHLMPGCHIGRDCTLGQNVFVAAGVRIGDRVKIQNNVSVYEGVELADDVFVGPSAVFTNVSTPRSPVSRKSSFERTVVQRGATIGANATILCGHTIGEYALVGAAAVVTDDVSPQTIVMGNPAGAAGWVCRCGSRLRQSLTCSQCQESFVLERGGLRPSVVPPPPIENGER